MQYRFLVVIEKGNETYAAYVPDLPNCMAVGTTLEEVEKNMQEALIQHVQELIERQEPIPQPQTTARFVEMTMPELPDSQTSM